MNAYGICLLGLAQTMACSDQGHKTAETAKPNVLFICVDDLRPELGCYGAGHIKSPNIDKLAKSGVVFTNQFVSIPTCGASRYSLLTGMLPREKGHLSNDAIRNYISGKPETDIPESFIHHLRRNGYHTVGIGKISHYVDGLLYGYEDPVGNRRELPYSWDELLFDAGKWGTGWNAFFGYADGENRQSMKKQVKPYERGETGDDGYPDGLTANMAIGKLRELKDSDKPFFLGVGFFKPHLPFTAPAKYWDMYDPDNIPLTPSPDIPENVHRRSLHGSNEFNGYLAGEEKASLDKPVSENYQRTLRHAYFAAVSYVDAQIGKVLNELENLGLADNTVVVVWGDHGWHLGDHRVWGKHTVLDRALKSAFIMRVPQHNNPGRQIDNIIGSVDIYPTIIELCGLEMTTPTDGQSIVPLLENADNGHWPDMAWSYYNNGVSLRTDRYRLTKYFRKEQPVIELYDHKNDPFENENIAGKDPETVKHLLPILESKQHNIFN